MNRMSSFLPTETPNKAVVVSLRTVLVILLLVSSLVLLRRKQERIDSRCAVMFVSKTLELEEKTWRGRKRMREKREEDNYWSQMSFSRKLSQFSITLNLLLTCCCRTHSLRHPEVRQSNGKMGKRKKKIEKRKEKERQKEDRV